MSELNAHEVQRKTRMALVYFARFSVSLTLIRVFTVYTAYKLTWLLFSLLSFQLEICVFSAFVFFNSIQTNRYDCGMIVVWCGKSCCRILKFSDAIGCNLVVKHYWLKTSIQTRPRRPRLHGGQLYWLK